jgi:hypothetical protein
MIFYCNSIFFYSKADINPNAGTYFLYTVRANKLYLKQGLFCSQCDSWGGAAIFLCGSYHIYYQNGQKGKKN